MDFLALIIKLAKQIWFQRFNERVGGQQIFEFRHKCFKRGWLAFNLGQILCDCKDVFRLVAKFKVFAKY